MYGLTKKDTSEDAENAEAMANIEGAFNEATTTVEATEETPRLNIMNSSDESEANNVEE